MIAPDVVPPVTMQQLEFQTHKPEVSHDQNGAVQFLQCFILGLQYYSSAAGNL
jgi:hypothetical protein